MWQFVDGKLHEKYAVVQKHFIQDNYDLVMISFPWCMPFRVMI